MEIVSNLAYILVGAVVGGLLPVFTGFLSDRRKRNHEHDAWLRQRRLEYFHDLMEATHKGLGPEDVYEVHRAANRLYVVIPRLLEGDLRRFQANYTDLMARPKATQEEERANGLAMGLQEGFIMGAFRYKMGLDTDPLGLPRRKQKANRSLNEEALKEMERLANKHLEALKGALTP